uniref:Uncharacterized protein n=1 Tax=Cacopsylla melanoneura TaxID=428564 RepID=A0A8D8SLW6_9HEMI
MLFLCDYNMYSCHWYWVRTFLATIRIRSLIILKNFQPEVCSFEWPNFLPHLFKQYLLCLYFLIIITRPMETMDCRRKRVLGRFRRSPNLYFRFSTKTRHRNCFDNTYLVYTYPFGWDMGRTTGKSSTIKQKS